MTYQSQATEKKNASRVSTSILTVIGGFLLVVSTVIATLGISNSITSSRIPTEKTPTATITTGIVEQKINASLIAQPAAIIDVGAEGTVTQKGVAKGGIIKEGGIIGVVNERPIFLAQGAIPMYRTLTTGATGKDVEQLQSTLKRLGYAVSDAAGSYRSSTAWSVAAWYSDRGFTPVDSGGGTLARNAWGQAAVPQRELVFLASTPANAKTACGITGAQVQGPLCSLETEKREYVIKVATGLTTDAKKLEGLTVHLALDKVISAQVGSEKTTADADAQNVPTDALDSDDNANASSSTGDAASGSDADQYRYFSLILPEKKTLPRSSDGASATIIARSSGKKGFLVASVALHNNGSNDSYWIETTDETHVPVTVGMCYEGQCALTGDKIHSGMAVMLPKSAAPTTESQE